jgi:hypothetical protein
MLQAMVAAALTAPAAFAAGRFDGTSTTFRLAHPAPQPGEQAHVMGFTARFTRTALTAG